MDRRVIKTKRAIKKAFFTLLAEKDVNDISVTDISRLADINRKTFYNYYTGVYQLIDELEEEVVSKIQAKVQETDIILALREPLRLYNLLDDAIGLNDPFLRSMLESERGSGFFNKFEDRIIGLIRDEVSAQIKTDPQRTEYVIHFILAGEISVYKAWIRAGRPMSAEDLAQLVNNLGLNGVRSLVIKD